MGTSLLRGGLLGLIGTGAYSVVGRQTRTPVCSRSRESAGFDGPWPLGMSSTPPDAAVFALGDGGREFAASDA